MDRPTMRDSARPRTRAWVGGLVGASVLGTACGRPVPTEETYAAAVRDNLHAQGLVVAAVDCSEPPLGQQVVTCAARVGERTVAMHVAQAWDGRALEVSPAEPTVVVSQVRAEVRRTLVAAGHEVAVLSCEGSVWVVRPGASERCSMTDSAGQRWVYQATFTGEGSHHTATISAIETPGGR